MREASNIAELGALAIDYMGFIFYAKSPRNIISLPTVALPTHIKKVGVFVNAGTEKVKNTVSEYQLNAAQLHGEESPEQCEKLQHEGLEIFKAFGIDKDFDWQLLQSYLPVVDYFLFDTKSTKYGGTGRSFDWDALKNYPYDKPYFLSGGLSMDNIAQATRIDDPRLAGFDLNSKFEKVPGLKDVETLKQAVKFIKYE